MCVPTYNLRPSETALTALRVSSLCPSTTSSVALGIVALEEFSRFPSEDAVVDRAPCCSRSHRRSLTCLKQTKKKRSPLARSVVPSFPRLTSTTTRRRPWLGASSQMIVFNVQVEVDFEKIRLSQTTSFHGNVVKLLLSATSSRPSRSSHRD
jgi:hypothetical protein